MDRNDDAPGLDSRKTCRLCLQCLYIPPGPRVQEPHHSRARASAAGLSFPTCLLTTNPWTARTRYVLTIGIRLPDSSAGWEHCRWRGLIRELADWYDNADDSRLIESAARYFDNCMQRHFHGWEETWAYTDRVWQAVHFPFYPLYQAYTRGDDADI